jgi:hypothetical protein
MLPEYDLNRIKEFIPFNICLLGQRRSGKSIASWKLTEFLLPEFDLVISFLGTKNCNRELNQLISSNFDPRLNFVEFNPRVLEKLIEQQEILLDEGKVRNVLIVFDDVFATNQRNVELLTQLFIRGRHYRISCISASVCFTTLQKNCRRSMDLMFLYSSVCRSDNQILSSEYIHRNIGTAQYCLQNLEPFKALVIETKRNQKLFEFKFELGKGPDESQMQQEKAGVSHQLSPPTHPRIEICSSKIDTTAEHIESDTDLLIENDNM